jgi:hypothetical protein
LPASASGAGDRGYCFCHEFVGRLLKFDPGRHENSMNVLQLRSNSA